MNEAFALIINSIEVSPIFQHNYWLSMTGHWHEWAGCSPLPGLELTLIALQLWRWAHCQWAVRWSSKYHAAGDRVTPIPLKHHRRITSPCQNIACRQYVFVLDLSLDQGLLKAALIKNTSLVFKWHPKVYTALRAKETDIHAQFLVLFLLFWGVYIFNLTFLRHYLNIFGGHSLAPSQWQQITLKAYFIKWATYLEYLELIF